jgi:hypothetical protein
VEETIAQIAEGFIKKLVRSLASGESFTKIEKDVAQSVSKCAREITGAYLAHLDKAIAANKCARREAGYTVERRGDERRLLTLFGEVAYNRTYYKKDSGGYEYLVDSAMGIDSHTRISDWFGLSLANAAKDMSYAKASRYIGNAAISSQTVMKCVRRSAAEQGETAPLRSVPELHIDADEAHVAVRKGSHSEVPLISVYEGIGHRGKRSFCKNVFHVSEYGKTPDDLWEQAADEITNRYDLSGTKIYLHGDGAAWIQKGLEWLPGSVFVLDKYHKNKAITAMTAGLDKDTRDIFEHNIRIALKSEDMGFFGFLTDSLCVQTPGRAEIITKNAAYLKQFVKGISICRKDLAANNGGCTEPHVSHVLSSRLSSRPMAWSKTTLQKLAPVLAAGKVSSVNKPKPELTQALPKTLHKTVVRANKTFNKEGTLGLPMPDAIGRLPLTGKVTGTQIILKAYAG